MSMHPDDHPTAPAEQPVFYLRSAGDPDDWYAGQVAALGGTDWVPTEESDDATWVERAAQAISGLNRGEPAHLLASGRTVPRVLRLAANRPDLAASVIASDPAGVTDDPDHADLLRRVQAPTLVLVGTTASRTPDDTRPRPTAPAGRDSDTAQAQAVAGGVDNGVMVIVEGATGPVHREAAHSYHEWVTAFMSIAEGLGTLTRQHREETHA